MKQYRLILFFVPLIFACACDYSIYVAVRNYGAPCKVVVNYQNAGSSFWDNDTLYVKDINAASFDSALIRVNMPGNRYNFIAPQDKEIALMPRRLGNPIRQVELWSTTDSSRILNLWDGKSYKSLKKSGQLTTRGRVFVRAIYINNK